VKVRFHFVIISIFLGVIFVPVYATVECPDCILVASVEVLPSPVPNPIPDPIPTYTFSQCDDIVVRGKIPTDEVTPVKVEIAEKLTGEIDPIGSIIHTNETLSEDSRYWFDISLDELLSNDTPAGKYLTVITYEGSRGPEIKTFEFEPKGSCLTSPEIPPWIKNNARFWADGGITDNDFVNGLQYLIEQGIMTIPETESGESTGAPIPDWIKNNAGWWADDLISDADFVTGIQYLITKGIMQL